MFRFSCRAPLAARLVLFLGVSPMALMAPVSASMARETVLPPAAVTASASAAEITSPLEAFGHEIGADYHLVNYTQLQAYLKLLAGQSDRMKLVDIGQSSEGRTQYLAIVSSPENLLRLDHYKEIARRLAKAEGVSEAEARALAAEGKAVVWIDGGLHSTETVPPQALIAAIHEWLTAGDEEALRVLDDTIILFAPLNPDGMVYAPRRLAEA